MTMKYLLLVVVGALIVSISFAQTPYKVPFGPLINTIELTVENSSAQMVGGVKVVAKDIPSWIQIKQPEQTIDQLKPRMGRSVTFAFSIDKTAPIDKVVQLAFVISAPGGETWTKEISMSVTPPDRFEMFQNYPNPFNPQTTIDYTLPKSGGVRLVVYDILGQAVRVLVDGVQDAGYKSVVFDASNLPSGVYFYRLQSGNIVEIKKMLVAK